MTEGRVQYVWPRHAPEETENNLSSDHGRNAFSCEKLFEQSASFDACFLTLHGDGHSVAQGSEGTWNIAR